MPIDLPSPEFVWGLVPRVIGATFLLAFASLSRQVVPLVGRDGIAPLHARLQRLARDVPAPRRWFEMPTLFWFGCGDRALGMLPVVGMVGGALAVVGGPLGSWGLLACWLCWLSLDVCGLWLPWDTLLHEVGFLALFLPATRALPELEAVATPLASVAFMFRWLLVRLMWGFAKLKFVGTERGDGLYLRGFLTWMPMPSPLGWLFQKAPAPWLRAGCAFMWCAEVLAPGLVLFPGTPRLVGGALLVGLMLGIWATGNWGHFNLAYAGLCVALLDAHGSLSDLFADGAPPLTAAPDAFVHAVMATLFVMGLALFPLNSWVTQSAVQWNADRSTWRRPWLERVLCGLRLLNRLRLVGAYGVFPPNTSPPIKMVPVLEGSHDGATWQAIPWRFMPTGERTPPRFVAPHHPRLDHSCIYVGLGLNEADSVGGLMMECKPHGMSPYGGASWLHRVMQRVLEGAPGVARLLGPNPFTDGPPTWVRVVHMALKPTTLAERRRSGRWWHARAMCVLHAPRRSDPTLWERWLTEPESVHPELSHWRRRSPGLAALRAAGDAALAGSSAPAPPATEARQAATADGPRRTSTCPTGGRLRRALLTGSDLSAADVDAFWDEFVPWVADPARRDDWDALPDTSAALQRRFGAQRLHVFERIHERARHLLEHRATPHAWGDAAPHAELRDGFHLLSALDALVFDGEPTWCAALRDPGPALIAASARGPEARLYPSAVFRWDMVRFVILTLRARTALSRAPDMPFGIGREAGFLLAQDVGPQWFPTCEKADDGEWTVPAGPFDQGFAPPEDGAGPTADQPPVGSNERPSGRCRGSSPPFSARNSSR